MQCLHIGCLCLLLFDGLEVLRIDYLLLSSVRGNNKTVDSHTYPSLQFPREEHQKTTCEQKGSNLKKKLLFLMEYLECTCMVESVAD